MENLKNANFRLTMQVDRSRLKKKDLKQTKNDVKHTKINSFEPSVTSYIETSPFDLQCKSNDWFLYGILH